ncbi:MAG: GNAT family N-acetyltransferase [Betaproteobacteria bacterium]|nr:GNAT family N-acetyltransferase [Betaproteobacteria bacterium]
MDSASDTAVRIERAVSGAQFDLARMLFREYAATLETNVCLAGFEQELKTLPQMYGAPDGCLLLAVDVGGAVGCIGVRRFDATRAEMKRLYVRPAARGHGAGRALARAALDAARSLGYRAMVLDTLPDMQAAQALYRDLGFRADAYHAPAHPASESILCYSRPLQGADGPP